MAGTQSYARGRRVSKVLAGFVAIACLVAGAVASPVSAAAGPRPFESAMDISGTAAGRRLAQAARDRMVRHGFPVRTRDLRVLRDGAGILVVPRGSPLSPLVVSRPGEGTRTELVPLAYPQRPKASPAVSPTTLPPESAPPQMYWVAAYSGCYERLSDTWSWIDHCAQILRLMNDGDTTRDWYVLERWSTAGPNRPWVVKSAAIAAFPTESSAPLTWADWAPRTDRTGPCQQYGLRVVSPYPTPTRSVDRCETWDMTKGSRGGDLRLGWSGCACTQDRELAFSLAVSVPQGRTPSWYVPAEVHGYPF